MMRLLLRDHASFVAGLEAKNFVNWADMPLKFLFVKNWTDVHKLTGPDSILNGPTQKLPARGLFTSITHSKSLPVDIHVNVYISCMWQSDLDNAMYYSNIRNPPYQFLHPYPS